MPERKIFRFFLARILVLFFSGAFSVQAQNSQSIGSFDINKVQELSQGPQSNFPSSETKTPADMPKEKQNYSVIIVRIAVSLFLIIALIFGVSWLMRKSGLMGSSRIGHGGSMDVLEVLPLGQNRNVVMFRASDTVYVCGQTPSNITLIDKIDGQRAVDLLTSSKGPSTVVHFKEAFNQFMGKRKK